MTQIYFGTFHSVRFCKNDERRGTNKVIVRDVVSVVGGKRYDAIALPLTPDVASMLTHMSEGDKVVFRLSRKDADSPICLDCCYVVPYWYNTVPPGQWDAILDDLNRHK